MTSLTVYPESLNYGTSTAELDANRKITHELLEFINTSGADIPDHVIAHYREDLALLESELARRNARLDRLVEDPVHIDVLRDRALALQAMLPIHQYIGSERMSVDLSREGRRFSGRCPYLAGQEDEGSFTIFAGDFAWCDGCDRGGNLFAIIGLCEGLDSLLEQVKRAAEIVGYTVDQEPAYQSQNRSLTRNSYRGEAVSERFSSKRPGSYSPVKIAGGRVVS